MAAHKKEGQEKKDAKSGNRTIREAAKRTPADPDVNWKSVFHLLGTPAFILAPDHTILSANNITCILTGKTETELKGRKCWEIFHGKEATHPPKSCPMEHLLTSKKHETGEMEVSLNGRVYLVSCTPVFDEQGVISSIIHIATDIMQTKQAEEMVQETENRFRLLFEQSPVPYQSLDADGRFLEVNEAWLATLGYTRKEVIGNWFGNFIAPGFSEVFKTNFLKFKAAGETHVEFEMKRKDGVLITVAFEGKIGHYPDGSFRQTHCVFKDITRQKAAEEALKKSEELFRKIFDNSPLGMALVTPDFRFFSVNSTWISMTGYSEKELLTMSFKDLTHPDHLAGDMEHMRELVAGTIPVYQTEKRYIRKDGSILWGFIRVTVIRDEQGTMRHFVAQIEDITERRQSEEIQKCLINELARKNTELDRFTYTVSHDLKSPLLSIQGFLSLLEMDMKSGNADRAQTDIRRIKESAEKLERLITTLLALSRSGKSVDTPVQIPFADIVRDSVRLLEATLRQRGVTQVIPDTLPVISGDRQRLVQVMTNLLDNAVKFMGDQKEPCIEIGVQNDTGNPVFFVKDNGMGIRKENLAKIFGLYERFNPEIPGTGIGLATVKRIIEAHGGKIWVESEGEGKGTTFWFTLPVKKRSPAPITTITDR